jgi:hypothetical protein
MANWWHNAPYAEEYQNNAYNGFPFLPEYGTRRTAPAEEPFIHYQTDATGARGSGWYQGGRKLQHFKSQKYWVRPVDGARRGTLGRLKDAVTGSGPDVYVVANGDRRTLMRDMPRRDQWSNWDSTGMRGLGDANWRGASEDMDWYPRADFEPAPWARREKGEVYNFRTRKYKRITGLNKGGFWSDAHYPKGQRKGKRALPTCWREWDGEWHTTVDPSAGRWAGGRPLYYGD